MKSYSTNTPPLGWFTGLLDGLIAGFLTLLALVAGMIATVVTGVLNDAAIAQVNAGKVPVIPFAVMAAPPFLVTLLLVRRLAERLRHWSGIMMFVIGQYLLAATLFVGAVALLILLSATWPAAGASPARPPPATLALVPWVLLGYVLWVPLTLAVVLPWHRRTYGMPVGPPNQVDQSMEHTQG